MAEKRKFTHQPPWAASEVEVLLAEFAKPDWSYSKIARAIPTRTLKACQKHAHSLVRRGKISKQPDGSYRPVTQDDSSNSHSHLAQAQGKGQSGFGEPYRKRARLSSAGEAALSRHHPDISSTMTPDEEDERSDGENDESESAKQDLPRISVRVPYQPQGSSPEPSSDEDSDDSSITSSEGDLSQAEAGKPLTRPALLSGQIRDPHTSSTTRKSPHGPSTHVPCDQPSKEARYSWKNPARRVEDLPPSEYKSFRSFTVGENRILQEHISAGRTASEIAGVFRKKSPKDIKRQIAHLWNFGLLPDLHALPEFSDSDEETEKSGSKNDTELDVPPRQSQAPQRSALPIHSSRRSSRHTIKPEAPSPARHASMRGSATTDNGITVTVFGPDGLPLHPARQQTFVSQDHGQHGFVGCMHAGNDDPTPPDSLANMNDADDAQDRLEQQELVRMKQELALLQKLVSRQDRAREMEKIGAEIERLKQLLGASRDSKIRNDTRAGSAHS